VCTLYDSKTPNQQWSPQQIMCGLRESAQVALHCDNVGTLDISYDAGQSFETLAIQSQWTIPVYAALDDVEQDTMVLRLTCADQGVVGGFIATVRYRGADYSTTQPVENGYWKVVSSSDEATIALVYSPKTAAPWHIDTAAIADDAVWIWNENIRNTMVFEFRFADLEMEAPQVHMHASASDIDAGVSAPQRVVMRPMFIGTGSLLVVSLAVNVLLACCLCKGRLHQEKKKGSFERVNDLEDALEGTSTA